MNYGKSLEEVWQWREALGKKLESLNEIFTLLMNSATATQRKNCINN